MSGIAVSGAAGWLGSRLAEVLYGGLPDGPAGLGMLDPATVWDKLRNMTAAARAVG